MNANELTFGIEIETVASDPAITNDGLRIGAYRRWIQVPYLPIGWKAERGTDITRLRRVALPTGDHHGRPLPLRHARRAS